MTDNDTKESYNIIFEYVDLNGENKNFKPPQVPAIKLWDAFE